MTFSGANLESACSSLDMRPIDRALLRARALRRACSPVPWKNAHGRSQEVPKMQQNP